MGSVHIPWLAGSRRAGPRRARLGRLGRVALAVAVVGGLTLVSATQHAASAATGAPFGGTAAAVPGTVYAANYDTGGQGVGYNVTSVNGTANSYRSDGVDLEDVADSVNNTGAGLYDLGWTASGQWFDYTVNVATAGTYTVGLRLASPYGETDGLHIANSAGTNLSGSVAVPNTGSYQTWTTVNATVTLPAGQQTLRVDQDSNGWNLHFMTFTLTSGGGGTGLTSPTAAPRRRCPAPCRRRTTTPAGRASPTTSPRSTAPPTATAPTGSTWRPPPTPAAATTWAGPRPGSGSSTRSTSPPPAPTRVSLRLAAPTAVTDALHDRQRGRDRPQRDRHRARDRRLPDLDHGDGERHAAGRRADADRGPGQPRLEHQLPDVRHLRRPGDRRQLRRVPVRRSGATPAASRARRAPSSSTSSTPPTAPYPDSEVYWSVNGVTESIAQSPYYSMTSCNSCRINFYLGSHHQPVPRLHRAELQRHHDQRRHLAGRRVRPAAGDPPAQLRRHRHRRRRERLRSSPRAGPPCSSSSRTSSPRRSSSSPPCTRPTPSRRPATSRPSSPAAPTRAT